MVSYQQHVVHTSSVTDKRHHGTLPYNAALSVRTNAQLVNPLTWHTSTHSADYAMPHCTKARPDASRQCGCSCMTTSALICCMN